MFKLLWKVLSALAVIVASMAAQHAVILGWRLITGRQPPEVPEDPDSSLAKPLILAMASGAAIGGARLVASREAAAYYRRNTGRLPKELRQAISEENDT